MPENISCPTTTSIALIGVACHLEEIERKLLLVFQKSEMRAVSESQQVVERCFHVEFQVICVHVMCPLCSIISKSEVNRAK